MYVARSFSFCVAMPKMIASLRRFGAASLQDQWQHFVGHCGNWHGTWQRYAVDAAGALLPEQRFRAACNPELAPNQRSVHHVNRYELGVPAPPGVPPDRLRIRDGVQEADFGTFDATNFRQPFGPASRAVYLTDSAVIASSSLRGDSPMIAAEFIAVAVGQDSPCAGEGARQRRRLVATWRKDSELETASLSTVTCISECEERRGVALQVEPSCAQKARHTAVGSNSGTLEVLSMWQNSRTVAGIDGTLLKKEKLQGTQVPLPDHTMEAGLCAWLPLALPLGHGRDLEIGMGWAVSDTTFVRVAAQYSDGEFARVVHERLVRDLNPGSDC
mmetsp:Transcript_113080/g.292411  ORF Transcript_113080/g.292411 Transcript_113080/m.292411 type:complete len:330 (+) Transcript_113080:3-992(+)